MPRSTGNRRECESGLPTVGQVILAQAGQTSGIPAQAGTCFVIPAKAGIQASIDLSSFVRLARMSAFAAMTKLMLAGVVLGVFAAVSTPNAAYAQSRTTPDGSKVGGGAAGGPVLGVPLPNLPIPTGPTGDGKTPDGPTRGDPPKGGVDGLPDAVTVLEILRRLPRWPSPGSSSGSDSTPDSDAPPDNSPEPQTGRPATPADAPRAPNRVVTLNPSQPFVPRPSPRGDGAPPPITGASVPDSRPREVIVTLGPGATANTVYELSQDLGLDGDTLYVSNLLGTRVVRFRIPDTRSVAGVVQQLSGDARVQVAQPNYVFTANGAAAGKMLPQYAPQKLRLDEAHKIASGSKIKIAVIDTAIDASHPVFGGSIAAAFDALGETKGEAELHGTSIAGIVAARSQLQGVAPQAQILGVRAFAKGTANAAQSHTLAILKGLDWAVLNGARVVNMSFAGPNDPLLGQAIAAAVKQGVVVVAAAGNGGPDAAPAYPGAFPNVIAVTAIDDKDVIYKSANRGTYIAVAAPGVEIIGAAPQGGYEMSSGTSMAAAHVSGIAALMLEKNPKATPKDIRDGLSKSARQPPRLIAEDMGAGIVDAAEALKGK